ncbi:MAG TPA: formate dehydrogenase accessory protein FdhE [Methylococcus sp.]|nr:formate dehydrogenase accessory protein FdhE [Methylococcus sp.]
MALTDPGLSFVRLPEPGSIFARRAVRLGELAEAQVSLRGYLRLLSALVEIQRDLATDRARLGESSAECSLVGLDDPTAERSLEVALGVPMGWQETFREICVRWPLSASETRSQLPMAEQWETFLALLRRGQTASEYELRSWVHSFLVGKLAELDSGLATVMAAALQVHWMIAAARQEGHARFLEPLPVPAYRCPICGFFPLASTIEAGAPVPGVRYVHCALCGTAWHRLRARCIYCGSEKDLAYYGLDGRETAVKAETCSTCGCYLKVLYRDKHPRLDPLADDLATLSLDLLLAEQGYRRFGFNPFLIPGS